MVDVSIVEELTCKLLADVGHRSKAEEIRFYCVYLFISPDHDLRSFFSDYIALLFVKLSISYTF